MNKSDIDIKTTQAKARTEYFRLDCGHLRLLPVSEKGSQKITIDPINTEKYCVHCDSMSKVTSKAKGVFQ